MQSTWSKLNHYLATMPERAVQSIALPSWKEILFISFNIKLIISVTKCRLGRTVCCLFNGNQMLHVNRNFFKLNHLLQKKPKKNFNKINVKTHKDEVILNNLIRLKKSDFIKFFNKGSIWIKRLLHELNGRKKLTLAYSH